MAVERTTYARITSLCLFVGFVAAAGFDYTNNGFWIAIGGFAATVAIMTHLVHRQRESPAIAWYVQFSMLAAVPMTILGVPLIAWSLMNIEPYGLPTVDFYGLPTVDFFRTWEQMRIVVRILIGVMVILLIGSFGVFFERRLNLERARSQGISFAPQIAKHLKEGKLREAIDISRSEDYKYIHLGKVVLAALQEYQVQRDRGGGSRAEEVVESVHLAIERAAGIASSGLRRGVSVLAVIGSTSILVGLMASILGVIWAFQRTENGSVSVGAVSEPIPEAAVGTAIGLFVGIPAIGFSNCLARRLRSFATEMDVSSSKLVDSFLKKSL